MLQRQLSAQFWIAVLLGLIAAVPMPVLGFNFEPSEKDYYVYPDFCKAKMSDFHKNRKGWWSNRFPINEQQIAYWKRVIGHDWSHLHHYCAGLTNMSQANDPNWVRMAKRSREQRYADAARQIDYTRSRSAPGHPMWAQLSLKYAEALAGAGEDTKAMEVLVDLQKLNPKSADVYVEQARLIRKRGELNGAIAQLEEGLRAGASPGPLLFYLADYYYELGDLSNAKAYTEKAERAGMKMDRLKRKMPQAYAGSTNQ